MSIDLKRFLLVIFLVFSLGTLLNAQIIVKKSTDRFLIGKQLRFEITQSENPLILKFDDKQKPVDVPNFGLTDENVWGKFTITNNDVSQKLFLSIDYPLLDDVELWEQEIYGFNKQIFKDEDQFTSRKYQYPNYIFDLNIPIGTTKTYFLRIKSTEQIILPIYLSKEKQLWYFVDQESMFNGIYIGLILIMFLYNFFIFLSVKDKSYLFYVGYIICIGITQLSIKGFTFKYLWPYNPGFAAISPILFASLSGIGAILFTQSFLRTKLNTPRLNWLLIVCGFLFAISIITVFIRPQVGFMVMQLVTTITTLLILYIAVYLVLKKDSAAFLFLIAWFVLVIGALIFLLKDYGLLPYNTFTSYAMEIASGLEMALLSFGLANRINILKKEKEASQAEALLAAKENERIITQQNVILEKKVNERTIELINTNDELGETLTNLKQAQSQLVQSEKMASLGQLTSGIAHEINNPINFVTSNISPLKRDVELIFEAMDNLEKIALTDDSRIDKKLKIQDYKEELDYDYLKIEISHLLKGIFEGATRTAEIVKGLRIFSRVDEDDLKVADIHEGLASTLLIMNSILVANQITVVKKFAQLSLIECYPGKLNQVFLNIISNAIDAMKYKKEENYKAILEIITQEINQYVYISFIDNGEGMDEKAKQKIFDPFFTTKEVGEGTGLGMSIAFNTIKNHYGEIMVNSEVGKGTEITLKLPISQHKTIS